MQLLTCDTNVCKKVTIPSPSNSVPTPDITVVVDIPTGLKVESAAVTHGVINDNIWTIASLPPSEDAVLDICFNPLDCNVDPTGKVGNITISTTATESNLANNVIPFTLDYITCGEINGCSVRTTESGVTVVTTDPNGGFFFPHTLGVKPSSVQYTLVKDNFTLNFGIPAFWPSDTSSANLVGYMFNGSGVIIANTTFTISWTATV